MFCSKVCSQRFRDRRRYWEDVEVSRERSRSYYAENREAVLARSQAKRDAERAPRVCSECGDPLEGRQRVVCGPTCRERRFRRTNPEAYAAREAAKVERRREKRRTQRTQAPDEGEW